MRVELLHQRMINKSYCHYVSNPVTVPIDNPMAALWSLSIVVTTGNESAGDDTVDVALTAIEAQYSGDA